MLLLKMSIIFGIKTIGKERIATLCDEACFGKKYDNNEIEFFVNPRFYSGEIKRKEEISSEIKNATIINAVGEESVSFCLKMGLINEENIIKINNLVHCQIVKMF